MKDMLLSDLFANQTIQLRTLFFCARCGLGECHAVGGRRKDEEVGPLLQGPPLSRDSTSSRKLPHPLHLCTPLTLLPTPLYASLHTFLHMLSWPRLPLDEDVTCDT